MKWHYAPKGFDEKVVELVKYLKETIGAVKVTKNGKTKFVVREKTIVFCNSKETCCELAEILASTYNFKKVGLFVMQIGNDERRKRLQMFIDGEIQLMVTTDLLSRGVDIPDLKCVVQFDFSKNIVNHLNRMGRVARGGELGRALNFYDDDPRLGGRMLAEAIQEIGTAPLDGLFSRRRGLRRILRRTEAFRQMLITQGLPLPPHLLEVRPPRAISAGIDPLLEEADYEFDDDEDTPDEDLIMGDVRAFTEDTESLLEYGSFEKMTDAEKDDDFVKTLEDLEAESNEGNQGDEGDDNSSMPTLEDD